MPSENVQEFSQDSFDQEVLKSDVPVLVDFWAEWCAPCRAIGPTVEALATQFDGRAVIGKVDVDADPVLAQRFSVHSIPTLLILRDGEVVQRLVGITPRATLAGAIEKALGGSVAA